MQIDLRQIAFTTLWKKYEKKLNTEEIKDEIRKGTATYLFADYCGITLKDHTTSKYSEKDQAKIDKFIKENGIKKISTTKPNYSIEFVPSKKAIKEFNKMLTELEQSKYRNIAKVATKAKGKI